MLQTVLNSINFTFSFFYQDVIYLLLTSFVFATACQILTLPTMFGYVVTGVILGPSCLNILQVSHIK